MTQIIGIEEFEFAIRKLEPDKQQALKLTAQYLLDKIIIRHFKLGNDTKYGYTPLSPKYKAWKEKRFGLIPMLVLSGKLRTAVSSGVVRQTLTKIDYVFNLPDYARFVQEKRDFFKLSQQEEVELMNYMRIEFLKLRKSSAPKARFY